MNALSISSLFASEVSSSLNDSQRRVRLALTVLALRNEKARRSVRHDSRRVRVYEEFSAPESSTKAVSQAHVESSQVAQVAQVAQEVAIPEVFVSESGYGLEYLSGAAARREVLDDGFVVSAEQEAEYVEKAELEAIEAFEAVEAIEAIEAIEPVDAVETVESSQLPNWHRARDSKGKFISSRAAGTSGTPKRARKSSAKRIGAVAQEKANLAPLRDSRGKFISRKNLEASLSKVVEG